MNYHANSFDECQKVDKTFVKHGSVFKIFNKWLRTQFEQFTLKLAKGAALPVVASMCEF